MIQRVKRDRSRNFLIPLRIVRLLLVLSLTITQSTFIAHGHAGTSTFESRQSGVFPEPLADFSEYRKNVLSYLEKYSLPDRTEADMRLNLPFELSANKAVSYRGKFLLMHGLNDSAYVWIDMARALADRGYDIRAILLPGHGTHPADMLKVTCRQWLTAARKHLALLDVDQTPIYLGGFSLGGVIASILALENQQIAGLLLVSPAYHSQLNSVLRWSWLYAKFKPWMFGGMILEDNPAKYNSIPINSGTQYYRITRYLKHLWGDKSIKIPVLMVVSMNDSVVDVEYTRQLFQRRFVSDRKALLIYSNDASMDANENEIIRPGAYPKQRILNQSHLSLINTKNNPLLGENGTQLICNGNEFSIFMACMGATGHWYGAQHTASPDGNAVARTTYNPDFNTVLNQFDKIFPGKL